MSKRELMLFGLLLGAVSYAAAQESFTTPAFPTPGYFRSAFTRQPQMNLEMPGTLRDLLKDGKLRLSIADLGRLVVARNTQVWLARMDVQSSEPAVLRARAPFDPTFTGLFNST